MKGANKSGAEVIKKSVVVLAVLLVVAMATGCAEISIPDVTPEPVSTPTTTPAPTTTPTTTPEEIAKIGEEFSNEQVAITVHSVDFYDQITGGLGGTYKPRQEEDVFAIVDVSIRNVGEHAVEVEQRYVGLLDKQGNSCSRPMVIILGWPYELKKLASKELPSGEEMRGMAVFTAKEGTILDKVSYTVARPPIEFSLEELGEEETDGQAAVTIHSVNFYDQITDGERNTHNPFREGDVFAVVDLSIRNVCDFDLKIGARYVGLLDNQNNPCSRTVPMFRGWPYEIKELATEELASDEETRGIVIFTAKEDVIVDSVSYTTPKSTIDISAENLEVSVPPYRMPRIGEVARGGGIEMRVSSVGSIEKLEKEYGDEEFKLIWTETAKEGYELVVVDLSIKNVFIEPDITINPLYVLLIDTESNAYGKVVLTIALEGELGLTDLSSGEKTTGRLLFSVPTGVTLDRVMYKIGALGPPVQVSLRG